jgi:tRNA-2-methylthio-N6-dimethylallyladenosine synthase
VIQESQGRVRRYFFETYGCQMNKAEASALERELAQRSWLPAATDDEADLVLIHTCSVRATAETRILGRLGYYSRKKKERDFVLLLSGCMAQRIKDEARERFPFVDYVMGTFQRASFPLVLDAVEMGTSLDCLDETPAYSFARSHYEEGSFKAFLPIMHGCDNYCAYCIVPYLRGHEVSRASAEILSELRSLEEGPVREVTLLGQNVNSYREAESGLDFAALLDLIRDELGGGRREGSTSGLGWIRFLSPHPKDFNPQVIEALASSPLFAPCVHLPAQHGSNAILAAMNRRYTREAFIDLASRLRAAVPGLAISTDILVGFPGETEEDLRLTLELMEEVGFDSAFMYQYNMREGTKAATMEGQIYEGLKVERLSRVIEFQSRLGAKALDARLGKEVTALVDSVSRDDPGELLAHGEHDEMLVFPGESRLIGSFVRLLPESRRGNTLRARVVSRVGEAL